MINRNHRGRGLALAVGAPTAAACAICAESNCRALLERCRKLVEQLDVLERLRHLDLYRTGAARNPAMTCSTRRCLPLVALTLMAGPVFAEDVMLIVPGKFVGPITATTNEADLAAILPPGQVKRVLYSLGEGATGCGTEAFSGTPDVVVIAWSNESVEYESDNAADLAACLGKQGLTRPVSVTIENLAGHWQTDDGIKLGMTVSDLARLIGKPVSVSVCPCDYGGFIGSSGARFPDGLDLWADFPLNADYTYASHIDTAADYILSSMDIGADAESGFTISRMVVAISE